MSQDTVQEMTEDEFQTHCREARLRARFHRNPLVRAAREAYGQARVRGVPDHEAWTAANAVYEDVREKLRAQLAGETF